MTFRKRVGVGLFLAAIAGAALYGWLRLPGVSQAESDDVLKPAADFTLPDLQGKPFTLSSLRGKTVLLDFWATWCGPCLEDIPDLKALQQRFGGKGFTVVAVSVDDAAPKKIAAFARERGLTYPVVLAGGQDKIPEGYDVFGLPTAYLIDPSGVVRQKYYGPKSDYMDALVKDIQSLLRHGP